MLKGLKQDKLLTFTPPELDEKATPMQKEMWRIQANNKIDCESYWKGTWRQLFKWYFQYATLYLRTMCVTMRALSRSTTSRHIGPTEMYMKDHVCK